MTGKPEARPARLHPGHHWGPFAKDPWSPDLDPVVGEVWERAARAGRVRDVAEFGKGRDGSAVADEADGDPVD